MDGLTDMQAKVLSELEKQLEADEVNFAALASKFDVHPVTLREYLDAVVLKR